MKLAAALSIALLLPAAVAAQPVPEGIHSDRVGSPTLCGITGLSISEIQQIVMSDSAFVEEGSNDQYRVFNRTRDFTQFVFPRPGTYTFPMATCRRVITNNDGTFIHRELTCDGSREGCDAVFREFEALDKSVEDALRR